MMIRKLLLFSTVFIVLASFKVAFAQSPEQIESFQSHMQVEANGTITIKETILYNFGTNQRHGIYREIKTIFENTSGKKMETPLELVSITDEKGKNYNYEKSHTTEGIKYKIGDANVYVTGLKTYIIEYKLKGVIEGFSDHDEIYYNVTGNGWEVPIQSTIFTLALPKKELSITNTTCFSGSVDSKLTNCTITSFNNTLTFSSISPLPAYEGITIVTGFSKGKIPITPKEEYHLISSPVQVLLIILAILWYVVLPIFIVVHYFMHGRDPKAMYQSIPALFEAPNLNGRRLTPAEVGTIIDEVADNADISASIVDLAIRGYLKIEEIKDDSLTGSIFNKTDYKLIQLKEEISELMGFEQTLLNKLFKGGPEVEMSSLKQAFYNDSEKVKDQIYEQVVSDGFFPHNPKKIRNKWGVIFVPAFMTFNIHTAALAAIFGRIMPRKTKEGADIAVHARGLKKFLTSQEDQLEFQEKNWYLFEKLLPYAVAFGVTNTWVKRFKDMHDVYTATWYTGSSLTSMDNFSRSISRFGNTVSAASTTTSSSGYSSGFSGGSSGGGSSGGGGGGSW